MSNWSGGAPRFEIESKDPIGAEMSAVCRRLTDVVGGLHKMNARDIPFLRSILGGAVRPELARARIAYCPVYRICGIWLEGMLDCK